jgi:hypothetical protein
MIELYSRGDFLKFAELLQSLGLSDHDIASSDGRFCVNDDTLFWRVRMPFYHRWGL